MQQMHSLQQTRMKPRSAPIFRLKEFLVLTEPGNKHAQQESITSVAEV